jgi:hypothetical protein
MRRPLEPGGSERRRRDYQRLWLQGIVGDPPHPLCTVMPRRRQIPKKTLLAGLVVLVLVTTGTAIGLVVEQSSGSATPSPSFAVPLRIQRAIAHSYPQFAYLPTQLPRGFHYTSYDGVRGFDFNMWFTSRGGQAAPLEYGVVAAGCGAQSSPMHSFTVNGVDVSWSGTYTDQRAWRCVARGGTSLVVQASRSVEGDANPLAGINKLTPSQRRHALELAQVVAYAEPIR